MSFGHQAEPSVQHVADIDLAGRVLAAAAAVRVGNVALVAAPDLQPLGTFARHAHLEAVVDFQVIGEGERAPAVYEVCGNDRVSQNLFPRPLSAGTVGGYARAG